jgi:LDH2 family malate/lactate/ureidoglycolate dehydrogenase
MANDVTLVGADTLRAHLVAVLAHHGVPADQAATVADNLVEADLRGVDSHGCNLLALYVARLLAGDLRPVTDVTVVRDDGSTALLDGGLGFGQVAGCIAIDLAIERAREHGIAAVGVRESSHLGALAYYTVRAAEAGLVALAFQNGPTIVPPFGGLTQIFSTNPFSYALPTLEEPIVVYDIATTTVAGNKVILAKKRGDATIPEGWANDEDGNPTTDAQKASPMHLQWFGGHKGYGIALLVEAMAGVLARSCFGRTERSQATAAGRDRVAKGYMFITIDPSRFALPGAPANGDHGGDDGAGDDYRRDVDVLIRDLHACEPARGSAGVLVPGELEHRRRAQRLAEGVPLAAGLIAELDALGGAAGLPPLAG